ncbi:MAG: O-antigen ligase family protein [Sphaerochaetaceae bacterium]
MIRFLSAIGILKIELFFSIAALAGYVYEGKDSSPIYLVVMIGLGMLNMAIVFISIIKHKQYSLKAFIMMIGIPFILSLLYLQAILEYGFDYYIARYYFWFLAYAMPTIFIGYYCGQRYYDVSFSLTPFIELSMIVITAASIFTTIIPMLEGVKFTTIGGESYQTASYNGAFAFGMNLYYLFWGSNHRRLRLMNTVAYKLFQMVLLPIQIIAVIIPGGRGGFVLLFSYLFMILLVAIINKDWKKLLIFFSCIGVIVLAFFIFYKRLLEIPLFTAGFTRATEFFSFTKGINWDGTSGRLEWYKEAWDLFKASPIYGNGLFTSFYIYSKKQYPHNIILEFLMQGGLIYLLVWLSFALWLVTKYVKVVKHNQHLREVLFLCVFPITLLMFSKSYLSNPFFWYTVAYLVSIDTRIKYPKAISATVGAKAEVLGEIPLFKAHRNSQSRWDNIAFSFDTMYHKTVPRLVAFYSDIAHSGVSTVLVNVAKSLASKGRKVLVITTEVPNGYDIKYKLSKDISVLFVKRFEMRQIEASGITFSNFDYVFFDCQPFQNPTELIQFGIQCDVVVFVARTGISLIHEIQSHVEHFFNNNMKCAVVLNGTYALHMATHYPDEKQITYKCGSYRKRYDLLQRIQS